MADDPPYSVRRSRLVAENSRWRVYFDRLEAEDGHCLVPDYLTLDPKICVGGTVTGVIVIPETAGRIALLNNYRHAIGCWSLEAVKGFVDEGESAVDAAHRELAEEAALGCGADEMMSLGALSVEGSTIRSRSAVFLARNCHAARAPADEEPGLGSVSLYDAQMVERMARDGGIEDSGTLVAWFRAAPLLVR